MSEVAFFCFEQCNQEAAGNGHLRKTVSKQVGAVHIAKEQSAGLAEAFRRGWIQDSRTRHVGLADRAAR